jgi:hypothetical protein
VLVPAESKSLRARIIHRYSDNEACRAGANTSPDDIRQTPTYKDVTYKGLQIFGRNEERATFDPSPYR